MASSNSSHAPADAGPGDLLLAVLGRLRETPEGRWLMAGMSRADTSPDRPVATPATNDPDALLSRLVPAANRETAALRGELARMRDAIARARAEVASLHAPHSADDKIDQATSELDAIVAATEMATSSILEAAERMDEVAARVACLDEASAEARAESEVIGELTAEIFTACSFQDITGQRIAKVVGLLQDLERGLTRLTGGQTPEGAADERPDAHLLNGPAKDGEGIDQTAVDALFR